MSQDESELSILDTSCDLTVDLIITSGEACQHQVGRVFIPTGEAVGARFYDRILFLISTSIDKLTKTTFPYPHPHERVIFIYG